MDHAESAFIRKTYAHFATAGVNLDGVAEGVEHTRHRGDPIWESAAAQKVQHVSDGLPDELRERLERVDRYGFFDAAAGSRVPPNVLPRATFIKSYAVRRPGDTLVIDGLDARSTLDAREADRKAKSRELRRINKWATMLATQGIDMAYGRASGDTLGAGGDYRVTSSAPKLEKRVYKGIPDRWRAAAWVALAAKYGKGANAQHAAQCDALQLQPSEHDVQIDLDVPRTMRGHIQFHTRYGSGQRGLFAVLHATSLLCQECGYCQGMGPLAAVLLCYLPPPNAYALLVQLHDDYMFHEFFRPGFPGLREMFYIQQRLTSTLLPQLDSVMRENAIVPSAYATSWYMTLFSSTLPFATQLRVWDAMLLDGRDVLVIVAMAILHVYAPQARRGNAADWLLEALSAPQLPQDDDALMRWVENAVHDRRSGINMSTRHLSALHDVGEMPFRLVRPFLEQARVEQLLEIEESSPHLLADTQAIWRRNCLRDFSDLRKLDQEHPLECDDWRAQYLEKKQQANEARTQAMERIRGRYAEHRAEKDAKKTIISDTTLYPSAHAARRAQAQKPLGAKPPIIVGDIKVHELNMGTVPPELEILEIGDLSRDRFRGIFRLMYSGDAHLVLSIEVQANPLAKADDALDTFASPAMSRGMLFAATPLTVPMQVRLSEVKLRAIIVLVVSRSKGITLVFKNDPLESVKVSSTFDGVAAIQKYLQEEIEGQLREMFREDLPGIIHRLSQEWLNSEVKSEQPPPNPPPPQAHHDNHSLNDALPWPVDATELTETISCHAAERL
ncbi:hypothetical protein MCUN1_001957 [Malassezia cuniculi]|uniref:Rab-GAP TBC domain-containing protein n=1 Tax=Malassezia cuniculi TaxID=948313 RepID=A0AAF0EYU6_9BASI|nr:hypothetical protein MCUN1_001957 [Malassezia cuniculi]